MVVWCIEKCSVFDTSTGWGSSVTHLMVVENKRLPPNIAYLGSDAMAKMRLTTNHAARILRDERGASYKMWEDASDAWWRVRQWNNRREPRCTQPRANASRRKPDRSTNRSRPDGFGNPNDTHQRHCDGSHGTGCAMDQYHVNRRQTTRGKRRETPSHHNRSHHSRRPKSVPVHRHTTEVNESSSMQQQRQQVKHKSCERREEGMTVVRKRTRA